MPRTIKSTTWVCLSDGGGLGSSFPCSFWEVRAKVNEGKGAFGMAIVQSLHCSV